VSIDSNCVGTLLSWKHKSCVWCDVMRLSSSPRPDECKGTCPVGSDSALKGQTYDLLGLSISLDP